MPLPPHEFIPESGEYTLDEVLAHPDFQDIPADVLEQLASSPDIIRDYVSAYLECMDRDDVLVGLRTLAALHLILSRRLLWDIDVDDVEYLRGCREDMMVDRCYDQLYMFESPGMASWKFYHACVSLSRLVMPQERLHQVLIDAPQVTTNSPSFATRTWYRGSYALKRNELNPHKTRLPAPILKLPHWWHRCVTFAGYCPSHRWAPFRDEVKQG